MWRDGISKDGILGVLHRDGATFDTCIPPSRIIYLHDFFCRWLPSERAVFGSCFFFLGGYITTTASSVIQRSIFLFLFHPHHGWDLGAGILIAFTAGQVEYRRLLFLFFVTRGNAAMHHRSARRPKQNPCNLAFPVFVIFSFCRSRMKTWLSYQDTPFATLAPQGHTTHSLQGLSSFPLISVSFSVLRMMLRPFTTNIPQRAGTTTFLDDDTFSTRCRAILLFEQSDRAVCGLIRVLKMCVPGLVSGRAFSREVDSHNTSRSRDPYLEYGGRGRHWLSTEPRFRSTQAPNTVATTVLSCQGQRDLKRNGSNQTRTTTKLGSGCRLAQPALQHPSQHFCHGVFSGYGRDYCCECSLSNAIFPASRSRSYGLATAQVRSRIRRWGTTPFRGG